MPNLSKWWRTGRALGFEATAAVLCSKFYALGVMGHPLPYLPSFGRKKGERLPVLFVHGVFHNSSAFVWLKQRLVLGGWRQLEEINLSTTRHTIPAMAAQVKERIEKMQSRYGVDQVDVVAHSLGGIVTRYYLQFLEGDGHIRRLITLGTPHQGTAWSLFSPWPHLRSLHPKSQLMTRLGSRPPPEHTQVVTIRGKQDVFLRRQDRGFWPGVRNLALGDLGHTGILYSNRVVQILVAHLSSPSSSDSVTLVS